MRREAERTEEQAGYQRNASKGRGRKCNRGSFQRVNIQVKPHLKIYIIQRHICRRKKEFAFRFSSIVGKENKAVQTKAG